MIYSKAANKPVNIPEKLNRYVASGNLKDLLLIVPTNRVSRDLKRKIISGVPGNVLSILNLETLTTLSLKLLEEKMTFRELSDAGSSVLLKHCTSGVEYRYFQNFKNNFPDGTLDRIGNVIGEYKRNGITPGKLRKEAETLERSEKLKALDIADIYEKYSEKTDSLKVYETGDIYYHLNNLENESFLTAFRKNFPDVKEIIVTGFDEFTAPEVQILSSLADIAGCNLFIDFDYYRYNPMIFSHLDKCAVLLEMAGFNRIEDNAPADTGVFKNVVREQLFLDRAKHHEKFKEQLFMMKAYSKDEETGMIASGIKELLLAGKAKPSEICVAFNLVAEYTHIIREKFDLFGIPANITDRPCIDSAYPVIGFVNFLEITENNYYFRNILRALNSGFIETGNIDAENLKKTASELKIVSGKDTWREKIKNEINIAGTKDDDPERIKKRTTRLKKALDDFNKIELLLRPFEKKQTPSQFSVNLLALTEQLKVKDNLLAEAYGMEENNIKAFTAFLEMLREILNLMVLEYGEDKEFSTGYYLEAIRTGSGRARYNIKERSEYGVLVTSINEIRGLNFKYLFIGGMNDGIFPTRFQPEIFLSGSFKKAEITHQTEERFHFYQALSSWKDALCLSGSFTDGKRELVESSFLKDFRSLFELTELNTGYFNNSIYTVKDLHITTGKHIDDKLPDEISDILGGSFISFVKLAAEVQKIRSGSVNNISAYNGFVKTDGEDDKIWGLLDSYKSKQYSVTRLETYAKCPFKFFMDTVLNIEVIEEPAEEVEALELGSVLHNILFRFLTETRDEGIKISGCGDKVFEKLIEKIFRIGEEEIEKEGLNTPVSFSEKERITGYGGNREQSVLYRFVEYERNTDDGFEPSFFEVAFGNTSSTGTDQRLSGVSNITAGNVNIRGKIDRIDINKENNLYDIVDYKLSGRKPSVDDLKNGISLQLPVYLYTAAKLLKDSGIYVAPEDMIIYSLKFDRDKFGKDNVKLSRKKDADKAELNEEIINTAIESINTYVENIVNGKFNLSDLANRENKVCNYCNFKSVCRITEVKEER